MVGRWRGWRWLCGRRLHECAAAAHAAHEWRVARGILKPSVPGATVGGIVFKPTTILCKVV